MECENESSSLGTPKRRWEADGEMRVFFVLEKGEGKGKGEVWRAFVVV